MNQTVNPSMVTLARESRGLTQTALATAAGLKQAHLSKIESGLIEASPAIVESISKAVEMPASFFYQTDLVLGASVTEFFHRKKRAVPSGVLARVHAQVNIRQMHVTRLLRTVELPECRIPQLDLEDFKGNAAQVAKAVRAVLGVGPGPIPNIVKVIEDAGGLVVACNFGTYDVDAISRWVPGLPPLFFVNVSAPVDRYRMSLAHELGHMVMHRSPEPDMEDHANKFASEFLMPALEIRSQLNRLTMARLAALKPYWRVSMAGILKCASDRGCISPMAAKYLWMQLSGQGYRKREPAELDLAPERPALLKEVVDFHRREMGYSAQDLSEMLAATPKDLASLYGVFLNRHEVAKKLKLVK